MVSLLPSHKISGNKDQLMQKILILGSSGQVGRAIVQSFRPKPHQRLLLTTRHATKVNTQQHFFDFEQLEKSRAALDAIDILFVLRPPHLSNTKKYFEPLITMAKEAKVGHILFLSVQGAERISILPHAKIESIIRQSGLPFTFFRPSYFMQNLSMQLKSDIQHKNQIYLPAGKAPFLWVDVQDIGDAVAKVLEQPEKHHFKAYTITGDQLYTFYEVASMINQYCGTTIQYKAVSPLRFLLYKLLQGESLAFTFVKIAIHYLARIDELPKVSGDFRQLTGRSPRQLQEFIKEHCKIWLNNSQMASDN